MDRSVFYRTIWRWHFYAGLFVIPFILILSVTGALYLFKPEVERWEEQAYQGLPDGGAVSADQQRDAALAAFPGAQFRSYRLPQYRGDAAMIQVGIAGGQAVRDVFVSPDGNVLGNFDPEQRLMAIDHRIHGQLLLGPKGSWLVELAASWAIVMILTGLYLWWPAGRGLAGVVWPRLQSGKRIFWRDLHAVTGFWVSGLALVLLVTGLPWASAWGSAFKSVRTQMGWTIGQQDWTIGGRPAGGEHAQHLQHDHAAGTGAASSPTALVSLTDIVAKARGETLAFPVFITPPGAPVRFAKSSATAWTVRSDAQNRPLRVVIRYDAANGKEQSRERFSDRHPIDQVIGYGIAWHEGQLFGLVNQLIGVATAIMLITLAVSGFIMWRRRKPVAALGAPPLPSVPARIGGVAGIILVLAAVLPLLAMSIIVLWLVERLVLARIPVASRWMGLSRA